MLDEVQALYAGYAAEFQEMENNRRGAAGAFGLGGGPRDYPCHQKFAKDLELLLQTAADGAPEEAERILDYIYSAAQARPGRQDAVYWMLTAVHGLTEKLIPRLDASAARRLWERYETAYPRRTRLPAQKKVAAALKKQAAGG